MINVKRNEKGQFVKGAGFWTGKKRTNLKKTNAVKTMFSKGFVPWNKGKKKERICPNCQSKFYVKGNDFCSRKCALTVLKTFPKGHKPWNLGLKGFMGGEKNPRWKGGITNPNNDFRNTREYKEWRIAVWKRDDYTCQICGKRGGKIHADHIKPFALFIELRLDLNNGRTLCISCHKQTETWGGRRMYD